MIQAEIIEWYDAKVDAPLMDCGETFLVVLAEGNPVGWTHSRPVTAEYCFSKDSGWTVFDPWSSENVSVNGFVLWWAELPAIPDRDDTLNAIQAGLDRTTGGWIGQP